MKKYSVLLFTLKYAARWKHLTGSVPQTQAIGQGRPHKLIHPNCQYLLSLVQHKPTLFVDEYAHQLEDNQYLTVSLATIHRSFIQAGLSVK